MKIAITGGGGLIGRYVTRRLLLRNDVDGIVIIDREEPIAPVSHDRKITTILCDVNDVDRLEVALRGCSAVIHCVHAPFPFTYPDREEMEQIKRDNFDASKSVVETMEKLGIKSLVFMSSAYTGIPIEDNYGLGAETFSDLPRNYMLDEYGESRSKGEQFALQAGRDGKVDCVSLRPTIVYGEGGSRFMNSMVNYVRTGHFPYIGGDRRGMHQFIYAGNLAIAVEKALFGIMQDPKKFGGEVVFCMDETSIYPFREFMERKVKEFDESRKENFWPTFIKSYYSYIKYKLGFKIDENALNHVIFRLFCEKTIGFSNKKYRLFLDCCPEITQEEAFARFVSADNTVCFNNNSPNRPNNN